MLQTYNAAKKVFMPHLQKHVTNNYSIQTRDGELDMIVNDNGNTIEKNSEVYEYVSANLNQVIETGIIS